MELDNHCCDERHIQFNLRCLGLTSARILHETLNVVSMPISESRTS